MASSPICHFLRYISMRYLDYAYVLYLQVPVAIKTALQKRRFLYLQ